MLAGHSTAISFLYQTPNFFPALGLRLYALSLAVVLFCSFYGIGMLICTIAGLQQISIYIKLPVYFFIGFTLASVFVYLLGFFGILQREILFLVVFLGACITIHKIKTTSFNALLHFRISQLEPLEK